MKARHGITLVKLLIVVTIAGVLGSIVVPQFSTATGDAEVSLQCTNLQAFGKQIEPCEYPHDEALPPATGESCADGACRVTTETDINGDVGADCGPSLERIPVNPSNNRNTVRVDGAPAGANTDG